LHTQEIDIKQEILGVLSLTSLLKQENFLVKDNFIITSQNDPTCTYLGQGMRLHDIQKGLTDTWNLPLLTQAIILSQTRILLTTSKITTILNKAEFTQLINILGFEDQVSMHGHPNVVFLLEGRRKILTNYNLKDRNVCMTPPTVINLSHKLLRLIGSNKNVDIKKNIGINSRQLNQSVLVVICRVRAPPSWNWRTPCITPLPISMRTSRGWPHLMATWWPASLHCSLILKR
jgi:hypothetical protein